MKIAVFISCLLLLSFSSFAQYIVTLKNEDGYLKNADGSLVQKMTSFTEEGASSLPAKNCIAVLKTKTGKVYNHVSGRIDLQTGAFIFTNDDQDFICTLPLEQIVFDSCDAALSGSIFKSGFPAIDKQNEKSFYRVLSQGKATLLKYHSVKWQDITPFNSTNTTRTYTQSEQYYLYLNGKMFSLEKNKENLIPLLDLSKNYLSENKLNIKKEEDAIEMVDHYNSL